MKKFLIFYKKDKNNVKMINRADKSFELVITDDIILNQILEKIEDCEKNKYRLDIVWQMKHKSNNIMLYKNCKFSTPIDNFFGKFGEQPKLCGKKIKIVCDSIQYFSDSTLYINQNIPKSNAKYKNSLQLIRMLKLYELKEIRNKND
jgi:hypothetical protein